MHHPLRSWLCRGQEIGSESSTNFPQSSSRHVHLISKVSFEQQQDLFCKQHRGVGQRSFCRPRSVFCLNIFVSEEQLRSLHHWRRWGPPGWGGKSGRRETKTLQKAIGPLGPQNPRFSEVKAHPPQSTRIPDQAPEKGSCLVLKGLVCVPEPPPHVALCLNPRPSLPPWRPWVSWTTSPKVISNNERYFQHIFNWTRNVVAYDEWGVNLSSFGQESCHFRQGPSSFEPGSSSFEQGSYPFWQKFPSDKDPVTLEKNLTCSQGYVLCRLFRTVFRAQLRTSTHLTVVCRDTLHGRNIRTPQWDGNHNSLVGNTATRLGWSHIMGRWGYLLLQVVRWYHCSVWKYHKHCCNSIYQGSQDNQNHHFNSSGVRFVLCSYLLSFYHLP